MTTHELAKLLEHMQLAFGDNLKTNASGSLSEAVAVFREGPDQKLRDFVTAIRKSNSPQTGAASGGASSVIERIRAIRAGTAPAGEVVDFNNLKNDQLKDALRAFKQPVSGNKGELVNRVRQLCVRVHENAHVAEDSASVPPAPTNMPDAVAVEAGVTLYERLTDDRHLSIPEVRAGFAPLRECSKLVLEEISRRVGYTPAGSREDILNRLLNNLEGIKMNQHRHDRILTGTSG